MGGLLSSVGIGGGASAGANFKAAPGNVMAPVTMDQANAANQTSDSALAQQQAFVQALQGQNGIQNQSDVYNQLQGIANGTGPNPAAAMLNQATGANVANQASLMAGQRGAGSNTGLIARQAAQQGGSLQQQAAGQAATNQANQSLNAINSAGNIAGQQVSNLAGANQSYTGNAIGEQQNLLNSIGQTNASNAGIQANMNTVNGNIAGTVLGGQQAIIGGVLQNAGKGAAMAHGGQVPNYYDGTTNVGAPSLGVNTSMQPMVMPSIQVAPVAATPPDPSQPQSNVGKFNKAAAEGNTPFSTMGQTSGGNNTGPAALQKGFAALSQSAVGQAKKAFSSPQSNMDYSGGSGAKGFSIDEGNSAGGPMDAGSMPSADTMFAARGGKVPAMVSPGESYIPPENVKAVAKGQASVGQAGERIPGKAKVKGDSLKNDTVSKTLEAGGMVIPRSIMESKDAAKKAAAFVAAHFKQKGGIPGKR